MGQKVSPNGLRIGINKGWNSLWYVGKADFAKNLKEDNTKNGRSVGRTSDYKKAIVWLTNESKPIEFFESLN